MFNRAWLAGGIPRTACVAAYEPICAVSLADSYINRANPGTYTLTALGTAPVWSDANGWGPYDATDRRLKMGLSIAATDYPTWSIVARFSGIGTSGGTQVVVGTRNAIPERWFILPWWSTGTHRQYGYGANQTLVGGVSSGVMALAGNYGYLNGEQDSGPWSYSFTTAQSEVYIGGEVLNSMVSGYIQAVYIYNVTLTPTQVKAVTNAVNMLPMRPQLPRFRSWLTGGATLTQFRKLLGLRTGSRGVSE